jgi:hypothetical protein
MYFYLVLNFYNLYCANVDVKEKNIVKVNVLFVFFYECFFYDEIAKNKEEFNNLICSRSIIMNLYVSHISNIR